MAATQVRFGSSIEIETVLKTIDNLVPELSEESIANQLFTALDYNGFKRLLMECRRKVILVNSGTPSEEAKLCVSEVTVKPSKDGLVVLSDSDVDQFRRQLRGLPRAFLVSSESVSMIEAKLAVYRKFKYDVDDKSIRIHHTLDEPADFLNHCGYSAIDRFQKTVEELKNSIPVEFEEVGRIVTQAADIVFSRGNIRDTCREIYLVDKGDNIGKVLDGEYVCRSDFTVKRIKENLVENTLREIGKKFCNKIFEDIFEHIRSRLEANINADLHIIKFSISDETFMKYKVHIAVVLVVVGMLIAIVGVVRAGFPTVITFLWSVDINSLEWRDEVSDELYDQVREIKGSIVVDVIGRIKTICEKTTAEIRSTIKGLEDAKKHVCPLTQKQIAEEWMLRDIRIEGIEKQPTILKIISGRVGHRIKVKVFLSSVNEEIKQFVRENAKGVPKNAEFTFVDPSSRKEQPMLKAKEVEAHSNDLEKRKTLYSIVMKEEEKLFAKHSNIIAIGTSPVRQIDQELIEDPCIVIYCLDKELVPFGEDRLPDNLKGVPCDIREDFLHLGAHTCTDNSHRIVHGCSIGNTENGQMGSVGFLAHENTNSKSGFLTAAHVAVSSKILGDLNEMQSTEIPNISENGPIQIIHLFKRDGSILSEKIGEVTKSFYGNDEQVGVDAAFVKFTDKQEETLYKRSVVWDEDQHFSYPIESNVVRREDVDVYSNLKVYKRGIATGVTEGRLNGETSVSIPHPLCENASIIFKKCFQIEFSGNDKGVLFDKGDSGSGIYLLVDDTRPRLQPLAIAFSILETKHAAIASPLENVLSILDVSI